MWQLKRRVSSVLQSHRGRFEGYFALKHACLLYVAVSVLVAIIVDGREKMSKSVDSD